jgi:hypothetical protein
MSLQWSTTIHTHALCSCYPRTRPSSSRGTPGKVYMTNGPWWMLASLLSMSSVQRHEGDTLATGHCGDRFAPLCHYSQGRNHVRNIDIPILCSRLCDRGLLFGIAFCASQNPLLTPVTEYPCFVSSPIQSNILHCLAHLSDVPPH